MKWATVAGVALLVYLIATRGASSDPRNPANWNYVPGYVPGSGYYA